MIAPSFRGRHRAMVPSDDSLPPWRPLLRAARQREGRSPLARWLQLATVAADGTPRLRTLVFRGWGGPAALDLLSDGRSAKVAELQHRREVELCWLLPRACCQFRLRGRLLGLPVDVEEEERRRHWQQLSPGGRALWGWPEPGAPLQADGPFPAELPPEMPMPPWFLLLRFSLEQVELLELSGHPHRRRRWRADAAWHEQPLNP
ncbi:MAG: pyridoxamine 5'-phosphate oxidase family protein [Prochlorococcaceae cyanobacterium]